MNKEDAYDKVMNILSEESLSLEMIREYGSQAPVTPLGLKNVNKQHVICISDELIEDLYKIHTYTNQTGCEIPFFLFGKERDDGSVIFNQIVVGQGDNTQEADFSSISTQLLTFINHVKNNNLSNQIVCHGHTHGNGKYSDNFSLEDMAAYIMMNDIHPLIKNKTIQTVGCVFNSSGDLNFVLHDDYNNGFYKFPEVNIEYGDGSREQLPAYSRGNYHISNCR